MKTLATFRRHQVSWARKALAAFAVVWLNMALQPCAMALVDEHDCPHCPEPMQHEMPCEEGPTLCTFIGDYDYDGRTPQAKLKDNSGDAFVAIVSIPVAVLPRATPTTGPPPATAAPPGNGPPLHLRHCVFLN